MNGTSLVVDSNIFIYQLGGDTTLEAVLEGKNIFISFITKIELLSYRKHSRHQEDLVEEILRSTSLVHSNDTIIELTIHFRNSYSIKTPDVIILGTAAYLGLPLLTADKDLFKVKGVEIIQYSI
jgi:predicted nucleic acid-binding protein